MEVLPATVWFPVVTLIIGVILKAAFDYFSERRRLRIDQEMRSDDRSFRARIERDAFQRETLLELQEVIDEFARFVHRAHFEDRKAFDETGTWGQNMLSSDVNEGVAARLRRISILRSRISDGGLKDSVNACSTIGSLVLSHKGSDNLVEHLTDFQDRVVWLNEEIGSRLVLMTWGDEKSISGARP